MGHHPADRGRSARHLVHLQRIHHPSYADESYPQFGSDKARVEIIVYSDYFCPHCRKIDEQVNTILGRLKDRVRIRFVDVPLHPGPLNMGGVSLCMVCFGKQPGNLCHGEGVAF